jgi:hypothetical protein
MREALARAKATYRYDSLYTTKVAFEREGRAVIQAKVEAILNTDQTLVTISFGGEPGARIPMSFTPFGVTAVTPRSAIYDLVPIVIRFPSRSLLRMKQAIPVLVDRQARTVTFAVSSPPSAFAALREQDRRHRGFHAHRRGRLRDRGGREPRPDQGMTAILASLRGDKPE